MGVGGLRAFLIFILVIPMGGGAVALCLARSTVGQVTMTFEAAETWLSRRMLAATCGDVFDALKENNSHETHHWHHNLWACTTTRVTYSDGCSGRTACQQEGQQFLVHGILSPYLSRAASPRRSPLITVNRSRCMNQTNTLLHNRCEHSRFLIPSDCWCQAKD